MGFSVYCSAETFFFTLCSGPCSSPQTVPPKSKIQGQLPLNGIHIYQDVIEYECDRGYEHTGGDLLRSCGQNGNWTGTDPTCTGARLDEVLLD